MKNRIYGLDIMRAAAIMFVLLYHGSFYISDSGANKFYMCYRFFLIDGVTIFFVLSGFLIGGILIKTISKPDFKFYDLKDFWIKRWFRTLPNYFLVFILNYILFAFILNYDKSFYAKAYLYPFFLQNFSHKIPLFFSESWSLSVEEWFYLLIPFSLFGLIIAAPQYKKQVIFSFIWYVIIIITAARLYKTGLHEISKKWCDENIGTIVIMRLDSLMYGVFAAFALHYYPAVFYRSKKALFIAGMAIIYTPVLLRLKIENYSFLYYWYYTIEPIGIMLLLPLLNSIKAGRGLVFRSVTFISTISYSLYLIHGGLLMHGILYYSFRFIGWNYQTNIGWGMLEWLITMVVSIYFSYLLYSFFEKPMMKLRDRFN